VKHSEVLFLAVISLVGTKGVGQPQHMAESVPTAYVNRFDTVVDAALLAMRAQAGELKIGGVAVVAYFEGDTLQSWSSKMMFRFPERVCRSSRKGSSFQLVVNLKIDLLHILMQYRVIERLPLRITINSSRERALGMPEASPSTTQRPAISNSTVGGFGVRAVALHRLLS
jgi:hypothetical protein